MIFSNFFDVMWNLKNGMKNSTAFSKSVWNFIFVAKNSTRVFGKNLLHFTEMRPVHAAANGNQCGAERQLCGLGGSSKIKNVV